jgi:hypothetical protein
LVRSTSRSSRSAVPLGWDSAGSNLVSLAHRSEGNRSVVDGIDLGASDATLPTLRAHRVVPQPCPPSESASCSYLCENAAGMRWSGRGGRQSSGRMPVSTRLGGRSKRPLRKRALADRVGRTGEASVAAHVHRALFCQRCPIDFLHGEAEDEAWVINNTVVQSTGM